MFPESEVRLKFLINCSVDSSQKNRAWDEICLDTWAWCQREPQLIMSNALKGGKAPPKVQGVSPILSSNINLLRAVKSHQFRHCRNSESQLEKALPRTAFHEIPHLDVGQNWQMPFSPAMHMCGRPNLSLGSLCRWKICAAAASRLACHCNYSTSCAHSRSKGHL